MYRYNADDLKSIFSAILRDNVTPEAFKWLNDQIATLQNDSQFYKTFITVPRKTGKAPIHITHSHAAAVVAIRNHLYLKDWTSDRLARSWLLLHVDPTDADQYIRTIQDLFRSAEVQELVALYSSLPILAYPEKWTARCSEGIRSNISDVLTAIMCNNPYPSENLDEPA